MHHHTIIGIGEILWDVFPSGKRFGGAPVNFTCTSAALGKEQVEALVVSAIGVDDLGTQARESLHRHQVETAYVATSDKPTGQVLVQLDEEGRASYEFASDTAWDNLEWSNDFDALATRADAVCFGTLGQRSDRSKDTIQRFVAATAQSALRILDVNLRPPFVRDSVILESLQLANILKLNEDELPLIAELCQLSGSDIEVMRQLKQRFDLRLIALTRGPQGSILLEDDRVSEQQAQKAEVIDTVGAGDAFTAALSLGLLNGSDLDVIHQTACAIAAFVCTQPGATPKIPEQFLSNI